MKIRVTIKDPDALIEGVGDAVLANRGSVTRLSDAESEIIVAHRIEALEEECCRRWFKYGEYLGIEIDTDLWTITVLPANEV